MYTVNLKMLKWLPIKVAGSFSLALQGSRSCLKSKLEDVSNRTAIIPGALPSPLTSHSLFPFIHSLLHVPSFL